MFPSQILIKGRGNNFSSMWKVDYLALDLRKVFTFLKGLLNKEWARDYM